MALTVISTPEASDKGIASGKASMTMVGSVGSRVRIGTPRPTAIASCPPAARIRKTASRISTRLVVRSSR